jgi:pimeloyl-ACP methyl ester carboxylesterase
VTYTRIVRGKPDRREFWTVDVGFVARRSEASELQDRLADRGVHSRVERVDERRPDRPRARRIAPDQLRRISVPVALIWGRADRLMRFWTVEKASEQFGWPL